MQIPASVQTGQEVAYMLNRLSLASFCAQDPALAKDGRRWYNEAYEWLVDHHISFVFDEELKRYVLCQTEA